MRVVGFKVASIIIVTLLMIPTISTYISPHYSDVQQTFSSASEIEMIDLVPDPEFDEIPEVYTYGNSEEFSWVQGMIGEEADNYIELTWSHVPGTELSLANERETLSMTNDFIFFTQSIEWPYEDMPNDVFGSLEYGITTSGNFSTNEEADDLFEVYMWLIDSSENWELIYYSVPPYAGDVSTISLDLDYFDLIAGWKGMIKDDDGVQEDPSDILTVAFGLAPTDSFRMYNSTEPWRTYSGSVSVRFFSASLGAVMDFPSDPSEILQPTFNNSYATPASFLYPQNDDIEEYDVRDYLSSICLSDDNSVYSIGTVSNYIPPNSYSTQVLIRWASQTGLEWARHYGNQTSGSSLCASGNAIYTAGLTSRERTNIDILIVKYDSFGNIIWDTSCGSEYRDSSPQIGLLPDGSMAVCFDCFDTINRSTNLELVKLNSDGEVICSNPFPGLGVHDLEVDLDGNIFVLDRDTLYKFDSNCNILWNSSVWNSEDYVTGIEIDSNGDLYTASCTVMSANGAGSRYTTFRKWSSLEAPIWNTTIDIDYGYDYHDFVECYEFSIAPDLSIFAILRVIKNADKFLLTKINSTGFMEWNQTIGDRTWGCCVGQTGPVPIEVGSNGFVYVGYTKFMSELGSCHAIDAYHVSTPSVDNWPLSTLISYSVTTAGVAVIFIVLLLTIQHKRKLKNDSAAFLSVHYFLRPFLH